MRQNPAVAADDRQHLARGRWALAILVLVNLLPLLGVLFLDWDVAGLVILYWSENLVIGFYTLVKMLLKSPLGGLFYCLFFSVHYGGFCAVHGLFILTLLVNPDADVMAGDSWPLFLVFVQLLIDVCREVLAAAPRAWLVAFAGLVISHGASFIAYFLIDGPVAEVTQDRLKLGRLPAARE